MISSIHFFLQLKVYTFQLNIHLGQIVAKGGNVICNQHYIYDMLVIK
jgi:hypothetical protein